MDISLAFKADKVAKTLLDLEQRRLQLGETIECVEPCNNFKPAAHYLVVTTRRLLAVSGYEANVSWQTPLTGIAEISGNAKKKQVTVVTESGDKRTFKLVPAEDQPVLLRHIEAGRNAGSSELVTVPAPTEAAEEATTALKAQRSRVAAVLEAQRSKLQAEMDPQLAKVAAALEVQREAARAKAEVSSAKVAARQEKTAAKQEKAAAKAAARVAKQEAKEREEAENLEKYGRLVKKGYFGGKTVKIYDKGYVCVEYMTRLTSFEKLLGISYSRTVQNKSAGGRAAAAFATGGLSMLMSSERRDTFLTITTDVRVHTLKAEGRMSEGPGVALEAAGRAVLDTVKSAAAAPAPVAQVSTAGSMADELAKLASLRDSGVLSDDEFAAAKARLLG